MELSIFNFYDAQIYSFSSKLTMIKHFSYNSERGHKMGLSLYGADLEANTPTILYIHGFKGFKDWGFVPFLGEQLAAAGIRMLAMNFSHNGIGDSPGEFTELEKFRNNTFSLEVEEAQEIFDKYRKGKLFGAAVGTKMAVLGHSRGGGVALLAFCGHPQAKGICTWASVSNFARYPKEVIDRWRKDGELEIKNARTGQVMHLGWQIHEDLMAHADGKLNIKKAVSECTKPLCIIHGEGDKAVSSDDARAIFEWADNAQAELHLLPETGHTFDAKHPFAGSNPALDTVIRHTIKFFKQQF